MSQKSCRRTAELVFIDELFKPIGKSRPNSRIDPRMYVSIVLCMKNLHFVSVGKIISVAQDSALLKSITLSTE